MPILIRSLPQVFFSRESLLPPLPISLSISPDGKFRQLWFVSRESLPLEIEILIYPRWQNLAGAACRLLLWRLQLILSLSNALVCPPYLL
jgi:hypothetical protein